MVQTKRADFNGLAKELSVSPVSVRIMRNRGMETKEAMERYLYGTLDGLYDGALMKNMGEAVLCLRSLAFQKKQQRKLFVLLCTNFPASVRLLLKQI